MRIARILYPVKVLGPGERIGIWVCGCRRGCPGCANPELWPENKSSEIAMDDIMRMLHSISQKQPVDGITISGGEPFLQVAELAALVRRCGEITEDILVFTGYRRETLLKRVREKSQTREVLERIAVLVDGKYVEEKNENHPLRGSSNQRFFYRDELTKEKYERYIREKKNRLEVQNFQATDGIISVGIHQKDFNRQFKGR